MKTQIFKITKELSNWRDQVVRDTYKTDLRGSNIERDGTLTGSLFGYDNQGNQVRNSGIEIKKVTIPQELLNIEGWTHISLGGSHLHLKDTKDNYIAEFR